MSGFKQRAKYSLTQLSTNGLFRRWTRHWFARTLQARPETVFVVDHHEAHAAAAAFWPDWSDPSKSWERDGGGVSPGDSAGKIPAPSPT